MIDSIELCHYRQHRACNAHRALIENSPMIDLIKGCTEIDLHNPDLLPTLQCTLCIGHTQKSFTGAEFFLIKKLGGWKHITAFHKSSVTNWHQTLKHLGQYRCYGSLLVIDDRGGRGFFGIMVTLACHRQAGKLPRRRRPNTTLRWVPEYQAFTSEKVSVPS